jgi:hypothetical protein
MAKNFVFVSFSQELPGKMVAIGSGHFGTLRSNDQENIFYPEFPRKNIIYRKLRARK